jgi:uncharacterized membrane protein
MVSYRPFSVAIFLLALLSNVNNLELFGDYAVKVVKIGNSCVLLLLTIIVKIIVVITTKRCNKQTTVTDDIFELTMSAVFIQDLIVPPCTVRCRICVAFRK